MDLSSLDKGTAAHERTVGALIKHLSHRGIEVHTFARNNPRFDAGWAVGKDIFVAEVKRATGPGCRSATAARVAAIAYL